MHSRRAAPRQQTYSRPMNTRSYNEMMSRRREEQNLHKDIQDYRNRNSTLMANNQSDARVERMRQQRRLNQQNAELAMVHSIEEEIRNQEKRRILAEQDEALTEIIAKQKKERLSEQANRRRVCEEADELKELRALLRAARLNKERETQQAESRFIVQQRQEKERELEEKIEAERKRQDRDDHESIIRAEQLKQTTAAALEQQMREKEMRKQKAYEQFLAEKAAIDDVVRGMHQTDLRKQQEVAAQRAQLKNDIQHYLHLRRKWQEEEKRKEMEENDKINQYNRLQEQRFEAQRAQKEEEEEARKLAYQKVASAVAQAKKEEEDMEQLLMELYQEEVEQKHFEEEQKRRLRKEQMKQEMIAANDAQLSLKARKEQERQMEEQRFRQEMMRKFEEDKNFEMLSRERQRRERLAYKEEIEALVAERRRIYEQDLHNEHMRELARGELEKDRQRIVEEERARLLAEHAEDLAAFLPKGVFRDRAEFDRYIGGEN